MRQTQASKLKMIAAALLLLGLACGPLNRLQELTQKGRVLATGVAVMEEGNFLAFEAYEKLQRLPGYRLESRSTFRDRAGNLSTTMTTSDYDSRGNAYIITQTPDGQQQELYFVEGHTYIFDAEHEGWLDLGAVSPADRKTRIRQIVVNIARTEPTNSQRCQSPVLGLEASSGEMRGNAAV